jgi:hypothetical protein
MNHGSRHRQLLATMLPNAASMKERPELLSKQQPRTIYSNRTRAMSYTSDRMNNGWVCTHPCEAYHKSAYPSVVLERLKQSCYSGPMYWYYSVETCDTIHFFSVEEQSQGTHESCDRVPDVVPACSMITLSDRISMKPTSTSDHLLQF